MALAAAIRERARALGFHAVGFARADRPLDEDHARYRAFLERGLHGEMTWLADNAGARRTLDGPAILEGARTVVCLARRYARDDAGDPPLSRRIARYARGQDYHVFLRKKLQRLAAFLRTRGGEARALLDTAPVLERAWAARAGLGFVGKNGLLIVPGQGSACLLGEVVTTLELDEADYGRPIGERCGSCRACLDACPTAAFPEPFVLDARRCIAYLTIEARSVPPPELREAVGAHLFGCDDCQDVCPYNRVPPPPVRETAQFAPRRRALDLAHLAGLGEGSFAGALNGSPLQRARAAGIARNAVLAAAHDLGRGDPTARRALEAGSRHEDPAVRGLALEILREAAPDPLTKISESTTYALPLPAAERR
jgi:epoxyqueuosine reductase